MAAAFEAIDAQRIHSDCLGFQRVPDRCALVDHPNAGLLQGRHPTLRIVARRLDDRDAALDDRSDVAGMVRRRNGRKECQVYAEWLVGHLPALPDLVRQGFRRALSECCDQTQPAGVRHCRRKPGDARVMHAALYDWPLDAEQFGNLRLHDSSPSLQALACARCSRVQARPGSRDAPENWTDPIGPSAMAASTRLARSWTLGGVKVR